MREAVAPSPALQQVRPLIRPDDTASARRGGGGARSSSQGEVHTPVGGVVRRDDRVDGGAGRRGARGALGRDRRRGGAVDDPGVEDEGRARVLGPVEHGRARRAQAGAGAVSRVAAGVPVEDRRAVVEERAGARASASRGRLDGSRVPVERAVVDGRDGGPGGGRGRLALPTFREAKWFRRISDPTCWSAAPRFSKLGATTSDSASNAPRAALQRYPADAGRDACFSQSRGLAVSRNMTRGPPHPCTLRRLERRTWTHFGRGQTGRTAGRASRGRDSFLPRPATRRRMPHGLTIRARTTYGTPTSSLVTP